MHKSQCVYCIISRWLAVLGAFQSFCNLAVSFHIHIYKDYAWVSALIVLLVVRLLYFEPLRVSLIILARHNKEGRTQFVLTHPNYGSLAYHYYTLYSFERGSELEYKYNFGSHCSQEFLFACFTSLAPNLSLLTPQLIVFAHI